MSKTKVNPRKKPATAADVERARKRAQNDACKLAWTILFTVLADKEGYTVEQMQKVWREVDNLSDSIVQGYVNILDLRQVLRDEYGIDLID